MDRYTKTVLTVIAGCLLVLVGAQVDFPPKAFADGAAHSSGDGWGQSVAVLESSAAVYFKLKQDNKIIYCQRGECVGVYSD